MRTRNRGQATAESRVDVAVAALRRGDAAAACRLLERSVADNPGDGRALAGYAGALLAAGRPGAAAGPARRATELAPGHAEAWLNHGVCLHSAGRLIDAAAAYRRALHLNPGSAEAARNLTRAREDAGDLRAAQSDYDAYLRADSSDAAARAGLGRVLYRRRRYEDAVPHLEAAARAMPAEAELHNMLGVCLRRVGRAAEAVSSYRRAVAADPASVSAHVNLSRACRDLGLLDAAVAAGRAAMGLDPSHAAAANNLGNALRSQGRVGDAVGLFRRAAAGADDRRPASNRLCCEQYLDAVTPGGLLTLHRRWAARFSGPESAAETVWPNDRTTDRPLRVGLVSPDLAAHPVGLLLRGSLAGLRPEDVDLHVYNDRTAGDRVTDDLRSLGGRWRETAPLSDGGLTRLIRRDRIDVLLDMAGHTRGNRLGVFALRAAPVQASWLGYVGTTGLPTMDAVIADRHHAPPAEDGAFVERVERLRGGYVCFRPPEAPDVSELPCRGRGAVTFAAFHNPAKVSPSAVRLWSRVLAAVPGSRLLLKYPGMESAGTRRHLRALFAAGGVDASRLAFRGGTPHARHLRAYAEADLTLDTRPYSGGVTTCESLWMGVPVVTLPGETFAGRHSLSHLRQAGLSEFVAGSEDEFVDIAARWAADPDALAALRGALRDRLAASELCDEAAFARDLTAALRRLWARYVKPGAVPIPCGGGPAAAPR